MLIPISVQIPLPCTSSMTPSRPNSAPQCEDGSEVSSRLNCRGDWAKGRCTCGGLGVGVHSREAEGTELKSQGVTWTVFLEPALCY